MDESERTEAKRGRGTGRPDAKARGTRKSNNDEGRERSKGVKRKRGEVESSDGGSEGGHRGEASQIGGGGTGKGWKGRGRGRRGVSRGD